MLTWSLGSRDTLSKTPVKIGVLVGLLLFPDTCCCNDGAPQSPKAINQEKRSLIPILHSFLPKPLGLHCLEALSPACQDQYRGVQCRAVPDKPGHPLGDSTRAYRCRRLRGSGDSLVESRSLFGLRGVPRLCIDGAGCASGSRSPTLEVPERTCKAPNRFLNEALRWLRCRSDVGLHW